MENPFFYRNIFTGIVYELTTELDGYNRAVERVSTTEPDTKRCVGARILFHIFRLSLVRGNDAETTKAICKNAMTFFVEYMKQLHDSGLVKNYGNIATFIYDRVFANSARRDGVVLDPRMLKELGVDEGWEGISVAI